MSSFPSYYSSLLSLIRNSIELIQIWKNMSRSVASSLQPSSLFVVIFQSTLLVLSKYFHHWAIAPTEQRSERTVREWAHPKFCTFRDGEVNVVERSALIIPELCLLLLLEYWEVILSNSVSLLLFLGGEKMALAAREGSRGGISSAAA